MNVKCKWKEQIHSILGIRGNLLILTGLVHVPLYSVLIEFEGHWLCPTQLRFTTDDGAIIGVNRA